ncbi:MAG: hypothetical protein SWQ30_10050 [Thermodesulfobacteriota bacterium]|nr:hypothetical protein [Thermodesulfobacteriota bacterium]
MAEDSRTLKGKERIAEYAGLPWPTLEKLMGEGLPARKLDGVWVSHKDALDAFLCRWLTEGEARDQRLEPYLRRGKEDEHDMGQNDTNPKGGETDGRNQD